MSDNDAVLDVCTGNGAVALLIAEIALKQNIKLRISAVDISEINTEVINKNQPKEIINQITFISRCSLEHINNCIVEKQSMIVSQFGIEYTDLNQTSALLHDLLVPNGELAFIAHSSDSDVFKYMHIENQIYTWLNDIDVFNILELYYRKKITENGLKDKLIKTVNSHQPSNEFLGQPLFQSWQKTLTTVLKMPNQEVKKQLPRLNSFLKQHKAAWNRAQDMLTVAEKIEKRQWTDQLLSVDFIQLESQPLIYDNKYPIGHSYRFIKK